MSAAVLTKNSTTSNNAPIAVDLAASSNLSDQPMCPTHATARAAGPTNLPPPSGPAPARTSAEGAATSDDAQNRCESQTSHGVVNPSDQPSGAPLANESTAGPDTSPPPPKLEATANVGAAAGEYDRSAWLVLRTLAGALDDAQQARIAIANKLRRYPQLDLLADGPQAAEDGLAKALRLHYRKTVPKPIREWQKANGGIGEHLTARLLGQIGHPVVATPSHWEGTGAKRVLVEDPAFNRTMRQLWQYAGHGDPERSRRVKGATAEQVAAAGQPKAKMVLHLIAECAIKQPGRRWTPERGGHWATDTEPGGDAHRPRESHPVHGAAPGTNLDDAHRLAESHGSGGVVEPSPHAHEESDSHSLDGVWKYRAVYEMARTRYTDRTHVAPCVRCGPSGKPAAEGSPWSLSHQHAAALRLVGKEILRDLWAVAGGGAA